jgi:hypothetical protein
VRLLARGILKGVQHQIAAQRRLLFAVFKNKQNMPDPLVPKTWLASDKEKFY